MLEALEQSAVARRREIVDKVVGMAIHDSKNVQETFANDLHAPIRQACCQKCYNLLICFRSILMGKFKRIRVEIFRAMVVAIQAVEEIL